MNGEETLTGIVDEDDTPRVNAFVETLLPIEMNRGPLVAAQGMRLQMLAWAEFARVLERELNQANKLTLH